MRIIFRMARQQKRGKTGLIAWPAPSCAHGCEDSCMSRGLYIFLLAGSLSGPARGQARSPRQWFMAGAQALAQHRYARARRDFHQVLKADPGQAGAWVNLGIIAERQRRWPAAMRDLRQAIQLAPHLSGIELDLGLVNYHRHRYGAAARHFRAYLQQNSSCTRARYLLGLCEFFRLRYPAAYRNLKPLWPQERRQVSYLYTLAIAAGESHHSRTSTQALRRLSRVGAGTPALMLIEARAYVNLQQDTRALPLLHHALARNPRLPFAHYLLGIILQRRHRYRMARRELIADLGLEPGLAYAYEHLGQIALERGQPAAAIARFRQALRAMPGLAGARFGLGESLLHQGHPAAALAQLERVRRQAPKSAMVLTLEGQAYLREGNRRAAERAFARAASLHKQVQDRLEQQISGAGNHLPQSPH